MRTKKRRIHMWEFPLPRTHTGVLLGNGLMGAIIWGEGNILKITLGRSDFWDHRGGMQWADGQSYSNIRRCLEAGDEARLKSLFEECRYQPGEPQSPSIMPLGRLELDFGAETAVKYGVLDLDAGHLTICFEKAGIRHKAQFVLDMMQPLLAAEWDAAIQPETVRIVTSWDYLKDAFKRISILPPEFFDDSEGAGWLQKLPGDPGVCILYRLQGGAIYLAMGRGDREGARNEALNLLDRSGGMGFSRLKNTASRWWKEYWRQVPAISIPNARLQFLYDYGMYKFAGLTNPAGVAAGLQGPWIEEYRLPPWSSDYHFNINVQMCYWPSYRGNRLEHLKPLFEMVASWLPRLKQNAETFLGIEDGLMLPHAVDDRCTPMGGFWTGAIDHGCTAWVAHMMYQYYSYTMDRVFLKTTAYPFMVGTMRVYEEMLEEEGEGFVLPVSVSPEYRGNRMDAWGRNASFQLAAVHRLAEDLMGAAQVLGEQPREIWKAVREKLPLAATGEWAAPQSTLIGWREKYRCVFLWEGQSLEESHRHHSHLAGIFPFDVIDLNDAGWREIVDNTVKQWVFRGMGLWSGWCIPWASILHTCFGNSDMAEYLLETFEKVFTNEGHGTLHDCNFAGLTLLGAPSIGQISDENRHEIMQIDAGMGCTAAVMEMLLNTRRGINYLFNGAPRHWKNVSFEGVRTPGAFLVSASRKDGRVQGVKIKSEAGGVFILANPWDGDAVIKRQDGGCQRSGGEILNVDTLPGEAVEVYAAQAGAE